MDEYLEELLEDIPVEYADRFVALVNLIDAFCEAHLNDEYNTLCRELAAEACEEKLPLLTGKPEGWAAGIVYAIGRVNFLTDRNQTPHMESKDIAKGMGISLATMRA